MNCFFLEVKEDLLTANAPIKNNEANVTEVSMTIQNQQDLREESLR